MATTGGKIDTVDNSGLVNLASLFLGKNTNTSFGGSTSTKQTTSEEVSPDAVNAIVKQMLEGTQGLAAVAQGQKTAGLYNSSTNQLLVNDLLSRTAGVAAAANKKTVVDNTTADNRTQTAKTDPQVSPQLGLGLLGAAQLLSASGGLGAVGKLLGIKTAADAVGSKSTAGTQFKTSDFEDKEPGGTTSIDGLPAVGTAGNAQQADVAQLVQQHLDTTSGYGLAGASIAPTILESTPVVDAPIVTPDIGDIGDIGVGLPTLDFSGGAYDGAGAMDYSGATADLPGSILDEFSFAKGGLVPEGYADGGQVSDGRKTHTYQPTLADHLLGNLIKTFESPLANAQTTLLDSSGRKSSKADPRVPADTRVAATKAGSLGDSSAAVISLITDLLAGQQLIYPTDAEVSPVLQPFPYDPKTIQSVFPRGYADGGLVNTGLRPSSSPKPSGLGIDSSVINNTVNTVMSQATAAPASSTTSRTQATPKTSTSTTPRKTTQSADTNPGNSSTAPAGITPGAASGIGTNPTGLSIGLNSIGVSAPGLAGLASASNNASAVNSTASGLAGVVGGGLAGLPGALIGSLVTSLLMSQANAGPASTPGAVAASNANNASAVNGMDPMDAMMAFLGATSSADSTSPGLSTEGGIGVGDSSGASVGTDGDGGVGAGAALKRGGNVPGDDPTNSDSVQANLTGGEFVINRNATKMFRPVLEMINSMIPSSPGVR